MIAKAPNGSASLSGSSKRARFPRAVRLLRHADFERVYKQGRRHFSASMTVFYLRHAQAQGPRVGFTVGRVLGGAVVRNRIKRRLREAVRLQGLPAGAPVDVVINPKKSLLSAAFSDVQKEMNRAFEVIQKSLEKENTR